MTNYLAAAKVLDQLILDLRSKNTDIPDQVVSSLKSGRSYAHVTMLNPNDIETAIKAQSALEIVEMNLLSIAEKMLGCEYANGWQKRIINAYQEEQESVPKKTTFVSGIPKSAHWVRIETQDLFTVQDIEKTINERQLNIRKQDDGFTLIYGSKEHLAVFLSEVRDKIRKKIGK